MPSTRQEITRWRPTAYSEMHRRLDSSLYMTDLDGLEYRRTPDGRFRPVAIIECKGEGAHRSNAQREALAALGEMAQLPTFIVYYKPSQVTEDRLTLTVVPANAYAKKMPGVRFNWGMEESEYEDFLKRL